MRIGQEVVCINDNFHEEAVKLISNRVVKDKLYTIRDIVNYFNKGQTGVLLEEITNPIITNTDNPNYGFEPTFNISRFRPLVEVDDLVETEIEELVNF
jgi:hypothetical protein